MTGCGKISSAYFRLSKLLQAIEVRVCADLNVEIAQAQAKKFGLEALSVEDLLSHPDLDIVDDSECSLSDFQGDPGGR